MTKDQGLRTQGRPSLLNADLLAHLEIRNTDLSGERRGRLLEGAAMGRRLVQRDGLTAVALHADRDVERDFAQKREPEFARDRARAAVAEDVLAMAALR